MVDPTLPAIEAPRDERPLASAEEDQSPHSVVEHHVVEDDEWGEIEEIVIYSDAA